MLLFRYPNSSLIIHNSSLDTMLQNYIKITLRNLLKNKTFSVVNIFGLAAGISVCFLVIMLIKDANSYDKFHPESARIYRILTDAQRTNGHSERYASSPYLVGKALSEDYSQVELWTPLVNTFRCAVLKNKNRIEGSGLFTDASFFEMFGFEMESGNPLTALEEPYSVVLTKELAEKIFKDADPIGESVEMPAYDQAFKVTGVLKAFKGKTHLEFDALGSISTQMALDKLPDSFSSTTNILNYYTSYNFVRLKDQSDREAALASLDDISKTRYADLDLETRDDGYVFELQPLNDITPGPAMSNNMGRALPVQALWFFSILCIIIILSACFNYTNLTLARSLARAREVGVRKVMGANRKQIFGQFISEALIFSLFSLVLAYLLLEFTIPAFHKLDSLAQLDITFNMDATTAGLFLGFTILVGLIAGFLPAIVLSKFNPISIIQKLENVKVFRRIGLRKALIVSQFSISLIFILVLTIAWKQINYSITENFGSSRTDIVNVSLMGQSFDKASAAFGQLPQVQKISGVSHLMGTWRDSKVDVQTEEEAEPIRVRDYTIDHNYLDNFNIKLVAGENFPENTAQQSELFALVNEDFLHKFQMGTPAEAIGKPLIVGDSTQLTIRGVVKDFLYKPMTYNIEPLLLRYNPENINELNLTISGGDVPTTIAALERTWKSIEKEREMSYGFYDETIRDTYADLQDMASVVGYFGILGLIIAYLGLLGIVIFSVETKTKEIGIRRIIGATTGNLVAHLSKGYFALLVIAVFVAVPLSYLIGQQFLSTFAYSIPLNMGVFLPGVVLLVLLGILTIGSQTVKAALANPVESLRND